MGRNLMPAEICPGLCVLPGSKQNKKDLAVRERQVVLDSSLVWVKTRSDPEMPVSLPQTSMGELRR